MGTNKSDYFFGNHRSHGHYLSKGGDLKYIYEVYGDIRGCCGDMGGQCMLSTKK